MVSPSLLRELVDVFFDKVSASLPIFHRQRFYHRYFPTREVDKAAHREEPLESALLFNGIMALSARFSQSPHFASINPLTRGEPFAREAQKIYADATAAQRDETPTLEHLQGIILIAYYHYSNSATSFAWTLTGVCARLAYDLSIDSLDQSLRIDPSACHSEAPEEWIVKEEYRRAWWSVWELDAFASMVTRRPQTIDNTRMHVLLPVSDQAWLQGKPVASAFMGNSPETAWKALRSCPNQDERAWHLVATCLLASAYDLRARDNVSAAAKDAMETTLLCFSLGLPQHFTTISSNVIFADETFAAGNWAVTTNLLLLR
ncbi:hypothetical protein INS49_014227 [Diaporthe citri]|uniref:uncharacterized protein n=1 Tax=Diaporthe citri TaxID=83186 RepID=UPI001C81C79B|nr:uncharacterized protein INS49_014227 [Diaporthe citri]KAG6358343.1 hypothetical protein INS49_014227 [Diaporthe citri]